MKAVRYFNIVIAGAITFALIAYSVSNFQMRSFAGFLIGVGVVYLVASAILLFWWQRPYALTCAMIGGLIGSLGMYLFSTYTAAHWWWPIAIGPIGVGGLWILVRLALGRHAEAKSNK